jgi:hypothetical protein
MATCMPDDGIEHAARLGLDIAEGALADRITRDEIRIRPGAAPDVASMVASVFLTGLEMGVRLSIAGGADRAKRFLAALMSIEHDGSAPPLEIREREMASDIDDMLGVATIVDGHCPDCVGRVLYDEATGHLVCEGCGQLLREPR